jgi:hypothetical protein
MKRGGEGKRRRETYQAIFWPFIIGILIASRARGQFYISRRCIGWPAVESDVPMRGRRDEWVV